MLAMRDPYRARESLLLAAAGGVAPPGELVVAGWVFDQTFERCVLVRHRLGWMAPGGRLHIGESPLDGARREVREETGIDVRPLSRIPAAVLGNTTGTSERRYGLAYSFAADASCRLDPEPGQPARWCDVSALPASLFVYDPGMMEEVAAEYLSQRFA
ncbi:NUDIX hydrolase [Streptomyces sp. tea 10]|nr:NUDIX hydrolase [Streptomyces sp. tea 10]